MGLGKTYSTKYLLDSNNNRGAVGQVLSTTSTGIDWVNANTVPGAGLWIESGNDIYNSNSGNVGIGVTNPTSTLQVDGSSGATAEFRGATQSTVNFKANNANNYLVATTTGDFSFRPNGSISTTMLANGNVGIGTTSPIKKLHVKDTSGSFEVALFETDKGGSFIRNIDSLASVETGVQAGKWSARTSNIQRLVIDSTGNVGIGTTSPSTKLQVSGTVRADVFGVQDDSTNPSSNTSTRVTSPAGATYDDQSNSASTGVLSVILPSTASSTMLSFTIRVFDYANDESFDVNIAGYWYGSGSWTNTSVRIESQGNVERNFNVRFGKNSTTNKGWVGIGETTTAWSYVKFAVLNFQSAHVNDELERWNDLWDTAVLTSLTGYTTLITKNNNQVNNWARNGEDLYYGSGSGNVGIGTTSPGYKLDVGGTLGVSDLPGNGSSTSVLVQNQTTTSLAVDNGDFATDADWSKGTGWTISGGKANVDGTQSATTYLVQAGILPDPSENIEYIITYTISNYSAGTFQINTGGYIASSPGQIANGTYEVKVIPVNALSNTLVYIQATADAVGSIDNISVKQVTAGSDQIQVRELGAGAFGPTPVGAYLPLSAGSSFPLTGSLHTNGTMFMSSANPGIIMQETDITDKNWDIQLNSGNLRFYEVNDGRSVFNERVTFEAGGDVGIGVTNPGRELDVLGVIRAQGTFHSIVSSTSTNLATDNGGSLNLFNSSSTDGNFSNIGGYNSNSLVTSQICFINESHTNRTGAIAFLTHNGSSMPERMRITSAGNVGIGTTSPDYKLDVEGDISLVLEGENYAILSPVSQGMNISVGDPADKASPLMNLGGGGTQNVGIGTTSPNEKLQIHKSDRPYIQLSSNSTGSASSDGSFIGFNTTAGALEIRNKENQPIRFLTNDSVRAIISNNGNVGIGTTSPDHDLHVAGIIKWEGVGTSGLLGGGETYVSISQSAGDDLKLGYVDDSLIIKPDGKIGIGTDTPSSKLTVTSPLSTSGTNVDLEIDGGTGFGMINLKVEIPDFGNGIRIISPTSASSDNTAMSFYQITSQVGSISMSASATSFNTTSDYRLKENKEDISDAIERVKKLKPVKFNWIKEPNELKVDGFYAHELADIVPEAVTGKKDALDHEGNPAYQAIDQSKIVPLLAAALQQAIDKIEQLEIRIQTIENN